MFTFPAISTANTPDEQIEKIKEEIAEFLAGPRVGSGPDEEALDILQAAETLVRIQFYNRSTLLRRKVVEVTQKNRLRGYYEG